MSYKEKWLGLYQLRQRGTARKDLSGYNNPEIAKRQRRINAELQRWLQEKEHFGKRILDLGCGPEGIYPYVPQGAYYVGVDLASLSIANHKGRIAGRKDNSLLVADAGELPLAASSMDIVVTNMFLHGLPNLPRAIKQIYRVLPPGGKWVIADSGPRQWDVSLMLVALEEINRADKDKYSFAERIDITNKQRASALEFLKSLDCRKYLETALNSFLGKNIAEFRRLYRENAIRSNRKKQRFWDVFQMVQKLYYSHLDSLLKSAGFSYIDMGEIRAWQSRRGSDYSVEGIIALTTKDFASAYTWLPMGQRIKDIKQKTGKGPASYLLVLAGILQKS